eukprot:CAMPEP_0178934636 /NCGR_PEP_ID=MMETSP0786-20121207/23988_1 /TAXON_ID=186022 /ORGANISM="Thalassionema frauenfeldii, Strain CCMP 1798" /LENGTH=2235 /DNA_ID=CAMNT_0020612471 /DNA_START=60 /DNA_END=6767 /DNA_ORIENTATION=-
MPSTKRTSTSSLEDHALGDVSNRRNPRRGASIKQSYEEVGYQDRTEEELDVNTDGEEEEAEDMETDDDEAVSKSRSIVGQKRNRNSAIQEVDGTARRSSRSTKFQASLKEPSGESVRDLLYSSPTKVKAKSKEISIKSPVSQHKAIRRTMKTDVLISEEEDWSDEEDEDEIKIERIIAAKSERRKVWKTICAKINTSEIELGSRWYQEENDGVDDETFEERFLVKWEGYSYLHCSWEKQNDLVELIDKGKSYFTTFFRKSINGFLFSSDERCDGDYFDPSYTQIDRILEVSPLEQGNKDEIIFDKSHPDYKLGTGRQLLVKWGNTSYSESTYEFERDLIINDIEYEDPLEQFFKRSKKPSKTEVKRLAGEGDREHRRLYKSFGDKSNIADDQRQKDIASYQKILADEIYPNGGQLRDYQAEGVTWMVANYVNGRSSLLADEMGLGKTLQTCSFINNLAVKMHKRGPFLVVAPLSTLEHWKREFNTWTRLNTIVYHGSAQNREQTRELEFAYEVDRPQSVAFNSSFLKKCFKKSKSKFEKTWMVQVVITTPEMLCTDDFTELTAVEWDVLVVDEAHRMKNKTSKLTTNLLDHRFTFRHCLLLTGTPIQNNMTELWTLLNFIDEENFGDLDEFLGSYGDVKSKEGIDDLHESIRPYILRRLKEDVEKSVPPKEETLIEVELTTLQKQYYRALYEKNVQFLHRNKKKVLDGPSLNNLSMQLRKCCNHPFLLNGVEEEIRNEERTKALMASEGDFLVKPSGKLVLLDKLLPRLQQDGHRVLVFSQFKIMLDILEDYFHERKFKSERIDGSITGKKRQRAIDRFQTQGVTGKEAPFIMMLSTRAGGVGINLTAADTCIIFDSDWNPQNDLQAQARCHRIGQTKSVKIYRLLTRKTYEMQMFHMSSMKMGLDQAVLQGFEGSSNQDSALSKDEVEKLLRHGAYDIFNEEKTGSTETESNAFVEKDIDWILERRAKRVVHENTGSRSNVAGGTFSKASFKAMKTPDGKKGGKSEVADVDIDDPDFWKKMVGEAKVDDAKQLPQKKRKRNQANYNENSFSKALDSEFSDMDSSEDSDDESASSENSRKRRKKEPSKWGRKDSQGWKRNDAEKLVKALYSYGYGNISWEDFRGKCGLTNYATSEIRRLSWSVILATLKEAAEDSVIALRRKADRLAQKRQGEGNQGENDANSGGILAKSRDDSQTQRQNDDLFTKEFRKLLDSHLPWLSRVIEDAKAFAESNERRSKDVVMRYINLSDSKASTNPSPRQEALFAENLWPQLKNRGWEVEQHTDGGEMIARYSYNGRKYKSHEEVLQSLQDLHPELSLIVEEVKQSIALLETKDRQEHSIFLQSLVPNSFHISSLEKLLNEFAPLQLLVDRAKTKALSLVRKLLTTCLAVYHAHNAVGQAESMDPERSVAEKITKSIVMDRRIFVPHPAWTSEHDAVLIMSIAKHGWIEHESCCRAIIDDKTILWGYPFDGSKGLERVGLVGINPALLIRVAKRAGHFLVTERETLHTIKDFKQSVLTETYKLKSSHDSMNENCITWTPDEVLLSSTGEATDNTVDGELVMDLPSKKDLVKRAKALLAKPINVLNNSVIQTKAQQKANHGYCILNQDNPCNTFLAEILRVLLKVSFNNTGKRRQIGRRLMNAATNEAKERRDESVERGDNETVACMKRIIDHCAFANRFVQTQPVQAKNVIRAILDVPLVAPKNVSNVYFPPERPALEVDSLNEKKTNIEGKKRRRKENILKETGATGDKAIADAMLNTNDKKKFSRLLADEGYVQLSAPEALLLTVICSQGLPTWTENWKGLIDSEDLMVEKQGPGFESAITFWGMGEVYEAAAAVWHRTALEKLEDKKASFIAKFQNILDLNAEKQAAASQVEQLEQDEQRKRISLATARDYKNNPRKLAKKCIMLLESLRNHMVPIEPMSVQSTDGMAALKKTENLLGPFVLEWFDDEIQNWATSLELVDISGKPLSYIASDFAPNEKGGKELHTVAALMDQGGCRSVLSQIAQQSRMRSVFLKNGQDQVQAMVNKAVKSFIDHDEWSEKPVWWGQVNDSTSFSSLHDYFVLETLLTFGYGGIESALLEFNFQQGIKDNSTENMTRAAIQRRANQLTRTLDTFERTSTALSEVSKVTGESSNSNIFTRISQLHSCDEENRRVHGNDEKITTLVHNGIKEQRNSDSNTAKNLKKRKGVRIEKENVSTDAVASKGSSKNVSTKNAELIVIDDLIQGESNTVDLT